MKIKVISRAEEEFSRDTSNSTYKYNVNPDPTVHLFEKPREVVRAVNAAKTQRMMAQPFVCDLSGHADTPVSLAVHPKSLRCLISGSADGEVRVWDLAISKTVERKTHMTIPRAHNGFVNGIVVDPEGTKFYTVSIDKSLKVWDLDLESMLEQDKSAVTKPIQTVICDRAM